MSPPASEAALGSAASPGRRGKPIPPKPLTLTPRGSRVPACPLSPQVRLALLQLKGLEDNYSGRLDFPRGRFTLTPFGFL